MRTFVGAAALLTLVACKQATTDQPAPTKAEATQIAEQAEGSFTTGNVDTIMRQYADGAVMFDAAHPALSTDRKVQSGWARDFVSMKPADYHVPDRQIQILGPDAFVSTGTEVFTIESGNTRPQVSARFTDVFQRQKDGSWKIVNEHVSMPPQPNAAQ